MALIADLERGPHFPVSPGGGIRRTTVEITAAMQVLGYQHRHQGRPLPGADLPPVDTAVEQVLAKIRANRWARDIKIDREQVRREVVRRYLGVEPWPFAGLLADGTPDRPVTG